MSLLLHALSLLDPAVFAKLLQSIYHLGRVGIDAITQTTIHLLY